MRRRKRNTTSRPIAPRARGNKPRCGQVVARTTDGHVMRCQAAPHDDNERHNPGPWQYEETAA